jgi:hypothetical protein
VLVFIHLFTPSRRHLHPVLKQRELSIGIGARPL